MFIKLLLTNSHVYSDTSDFQIGQEQVPTAVRIEPSQPLEGDNQGLMGSSVNWVGTQPKATWSVSTIFILFRAQCDLIFKIASKVLNQISSQLPQR